MPLPNVKLGRNVAKKLYIPRVHLARKFQRFQTIDRWAFRRNSSWLIFETEKGPKMIFLDFWTFYGTPIFA